MPWVNSIIALGLMGACLWLWPYTRDFPGSAADFPRLTLIFIAVLSALMLVRSLVPALRPVRKIEGAPGPGALSRPLAVMAALAVALYLMRFIGFYPAVAGFGLALMAILQVRRPVTYLLAFAALMLFVFVIFQLVLNVPLADRALWGGAGR